MCPASERDLASSVRHAMACDVHPLPPRLPEVRRGGRTHSSLNLSRMRGKGSAKPSATTSASSPIMNTARLGNTRIIVCIGNSVLSETLKSLRYAGLGDLELESKSVVFFLEFGDTPTSIDKMSTATGPGWMN